MKFQTQIHKSKRQAKNMVEPYELHVKNVVEAAETDGATAARGRTILLRAKQEMTDGQMQK